MHSTLHLTQPLTAFEQSLITEKQLAKRWQKTTMTLLRMRREKRLPFIRIGKSPRYRLEDILKIEAGN